MDLNQRIDQLETRLTKLEKVLSTAGIINTPTQTKPIQATSTAPTQSAQPPVSAHQWLIRLAFGLLTAAILYLIKLSIDNDWFSPERRMISTVILSFALIGGGFYLDKRASRYAPYVLPAGIIGLFFASIGGHVIYDLYSMYTALLLVGATALLATALQYYSTQKFIAPLALVCTYVGIHSVTPFITLLRTNWDVMLFMATIFLVTSCYFSIAGIFLGNRHILQLNTVWAPVFWSWFFLTTGQNDLQIPYLIGLTILILQAAYAGFLIKNKPTTQQYIMPLLLLIAFTLLSNFQQIFDDFLPFEAFLAVALAEFAYQRIKEPALKFLQASYAFVFFAGTLHLFTYFKGYFHEAIFDFPRATEYTALCVTLLLAVIGAFRLITGTPHLKERIFNNRYLAVYASGYFLLTTALLYIAPHGSQFDLTFWLLCLFSLMALGGALTIKKENDAKLFLLLYGHYNIAFTFLLFHRAFTSALYAMFAAVSYALCALAVAYWRKDRLFGKMALPLFPIITFIYVISHYASASKTPLGTFFGSAKVDNNLIFIVLLFIMAGLTYAASYLYKKLESIKQ